MNKPCLPANSLNPSTPRCPASNEKDYARKNCWGIHACFLQRAKGKKTKRLAMFCTLRPNPYNASSGSSTTSISPGLFLKNGSWPIYASFRKRVIPYCRPITKPLLCQKPHTRPHPHSPTTTFMNKCSDIGASSPSDPSSIGSETPVSQALKYSPNEDAGTCGQSVFNVTLLLSYHGWNFH